MKLFASLWTMAFVAVLYPVILTDKIRANRKRWMALYSAFDSLTTVFIHLTASSKKAAISIKNFQEVFEYNKKFEKVFKDEWR